MEFGRRWIRRLQFRYGRAISFRRGGHLLCNQRNANRRRLLQVTANTELFIETLQHYRQEGHFKLHAFVAMPDHIHLLFTPQGLSIERVVGFVKGGFSHRLGSKLPLWQRGYTDHRIRDGDEFRVRRDYIHQNPVRAGIVAQAALYPYSSAYRSQDRWPTAELQTNRTAFLGTTDFDEGHGLSRAIKDQPREARL